MKHPIKTLEDFKRETKNLLGILADHINDDCYPRNFDGDVLTFDKYIPVTFGYPEGDATPCIEMNGGLFNFVISERGTEYQRIEGNADDILFVLFEGITSELAGGFEVRNRIKGQDFRRVRFSKQIELLGLLHAEWAKLGLKVHQKILENYPFEDKEPPGGNAPPPGKSSANDNQE